MRSSDIEIPNIVKNIIKKSGFSRDANASGGRCYEFRDALCIALKKLGYSPISTDSLDWVRSDHIKLGQPVGYAESGVIEFNNHAWVVCDGKHYDSLTPEGANRAGNLKYFQEIGLDMYRPDDEERSYQLRKYGLRYSRALDQFVEITRKRA